MIDFTVLPLFFTTIFFLAISPGPDLILLSTYSSTKGFRSGLMIAIGVFAAGILQTLLVAFGLGQLMQSMPLLAYVVKIVGALYLSYLGLKMIANWYQSKKQIIMNKSSEETTCLALVYKGFLNNLLNPKALLFFSLFLPQFTTGSSAIPTQILILGLVLSTFTLALNSLFSFAFSKFGTLIGKKLNLGRQVDGFLGFIFLGLATRLVISD